MDLTWWFSSNVAITLGVLFLIFLAWLRFIKTGPVFEGGKSLNGRTVLITGGSSGLGKETAAQLAERGARVVIASRDEKKGQEAVAEIRERSGNEEIVYMKLDLTDLGDVRRFVEDFKEQEQRLDFLINNAGVIQHGVSKDRFNIMLSTNVLGPFLLTNLLIQKLIKTWETESFRIINIGSDAYLMADLSVEKIDDLFERKFQVLRIKRVLSEYSVTKLMNIYFTTELNKLLRSQDARCRNITAYILHPGTVTTGLGFNFARQSKTLMFLRTLMFLLFSRSAFYACQTVLYCAMADGIEDKSGKYFSDMKVNELWPHAKDVQVERYLWKKCEEATGLSVPQKSPRRVGSSFF